MPTRAWMHMSSGWEGGGGARLGALVGLNAHASGGGGWRWGVTWGRSVVERDGVGNVVAWGVWRIGVASGWCVCVFVWVCVCVGVLCVCVSVCFRKVVGVVLRLVACGGSSFFCTHCLLVAV